MESEKIRGFLTKLVQEEKFKEEFLKIDKEIKEKRYSRQEEEKFLANWLLPWSKKLGYSITIQELIDFGQNLKQNLKQNELKELLSEDLKNVIGGFGLFKLLVLAVASTTVTNAAPYPAELDKSSHQSPGSLRADNLSMLPSVLPDYTSGDCVVPVNVNVPSHGCYDWSRIGSDEHIYYSPVNQMSIIVSDEDLKYNSDALDGWREVIRPEESITPSTAQPSLPEKVQVESAVNLDNDLGKGASIPETDVVSDGSIRKGPEDTSGAPRQDNLDFPQAHNTGTEEDQREIITHLTSFFRSNNVASGDTEIPPVPADNAQPTKASVNGALNENIDNSDSSKEDDVSTSGDKTSNKESSSFKQNRKPDAAYSSDAGEDAKESGMSTGGVVKTVVSQTGEVFKANWLGKVLVVSGLYRLNSFVYRVGKKIYDTGKKVVNGITSSLSVAMAPFRAVAKLFQRNYVEISVNDMNTFEEYFRNSQAINPKGKEVRRELQLYFLRRRIAAYFSGKDSVKVKFRDLERLKMYLYNSTSNPQIEDDANGHNNSVANIQQRLKDMDVFKLIPPGL